MEWEAVFWDFDGVILDSVDVKTKAFSKMFRKYGAHVEKAVVDYHLENGGVSRFDKFRYYYEEILDLAITEQDISDLANTFSSLVLDEVLSSSFIPGALKSLEELCDKKIPSYVVSGTPDEEIKLIVKKKGLEKYFLGIHGSPKKKDKIVAEIIKHKYYNPNNCLFLGDAMTDYEAAEKNRLRFLGIVSEGKKSPFPENTETSTFVFV